MANLFSRFFQNEKPSAQQQRKSIGVGTVIDQRFRLDAEIGRGGMGIIYRAYDLANKRAVAFKLINAETANALSLGQFTRESNIALQLKHPHIVETCEAGEWDSSPYLVMELVQGTSLAESDRFTYSKIVEIAKQICDALAYIHDLGFVYRDLKPNNVILEKHGFHTFVKLLDFGLARPRGEAYQPNESNLAGTVFYLAPELIRGEAADIGSDLYALGALIYEMTTGRVPFSNIDEQTILSQHLNEKVTPPSQTRNDIPPELEGIILRLLEKDPKDRFVSAQDVLTSLARISLAESPVLRGNLPQGIVTSQVDEVNQIVHLFETNKLITLLNDDETLAMAVGSQMRNLFADGVWFVSLETIQEPMKVPSTVAQTLEIPENTNRPPVISMIEFLREKNLLLVLDHCGHVAGSCAQLASVIMSSCPDVRILATSSQSLNIPEEKKV